MTLDSRILRYLLTLSFLFFSACAAETNPIENQSDGDNEIPPDGDGDPEDNSDWTRDDRDVEFSFPTRFDRADWEERSLDGLWLFSTDPEDEGEVAAWHQVDFDRTDWEKTQVPGVWNMMREELFRYKGVAWYALRFDGIKSSPSAFLEAGACFLECSYWLNGEKLGDRRLGYTPARFEVGQRLHDTDNLLVVRVDNRLRADTLPAEIPSQVDKHGWYPYGGLHRSVRLVGTGGIRLVRALALPEEGEDGAPVLDLSVTLRNTTGLEASTLLVAGQGDMQRKAWVTVPGEYDTFRTSLPWSGPSWHPAEPETATVHIQVGETNYEIISSYRKLSTNVEGLTINDERVFLYGISRHEDSFEGGLVQTVEELDQDVALLQELGVNFIRVGHYPADPRWLDRLRDAGIMIVEEIPVYQLTGDQMADAEMIALAKENLAAMIERDRNNPAIVAWSLMNEVDSWLPEAGDFAQQLADYARSLDPARPLFYAEKSLPTLLFPVDYVAPHVDIIGLNNYHGWYFGNVEGAAVDTLGMMARHPDKPLLISEFGAGAGYGSIFRKARTQGPSHATITATRRNSNTGFLKNTWRNIKSFPSQESCPGHSPISAWSGPLPPAYRRGLSKTSRASSPTSGRKNSPSS